MKMHLKRTKKKMLNCEGAKKYLKKIPLLCIFPLMQFYEMHSQKKRVKKIEQYCNISHMGNDEHNSNFDVWLSIVILSFAPCKIQLFFMCSPNDVQFAMENGLFFAAPENNLFFSPVIVRFYAKLMFKNLSCTFYTFFQYIKMQIAKALWIYITQKKCYYDFSLCWLFRCKQILK